MDDWAESHERAASTWRLTWRTNDPGKWDRWAQQIIEILEHSALGSVMSQSILTLWYKKRIIKTKPVDIVKSFCHVYILLCHSCPFPFSSSSLSLSSSQLRYGLFTYSRPISLLITFISPSLLLVSVTLFLSTERWIRRDSFLFHLS